MPGRNLVFKPGRRQSLSDHPHAGVGLLYSDGTSGTALQNNTAWCPGIADDNPR